MIHNLREEIKHVATFDPDTWRARAWTRYQKLVNSKGNKMSAIKQWERDIKHISFLESLIAWCNERKIEVDFTKQMGGLYSPEEKRIKVSGRLSPEMQVFVLLHECGHHLIGDKEKHERFGMGYSRLGSDPTITRTFRHKCDIIDEEYEAWHRGLKLARRLRLNIDKDRYDNHRAKMIRTYLVWALKGDKN